MYMRCLCTQWPVTYHKKVPDGKELLFNFHTWGRINLKNCSAKLPISRSFALTHSTVSKKWVDSSETLACTTVSFEALFWLESFRLIKFLSNPQTRDSSSGYEFLVTSFENQRLLRDSRDDHPQPCRDPAVRSLLRVRLNEGESAAIFSSSFMFRSLPFKDSIANSALTTWYISHLTVLVKAGQLYLEDKDDNELAFFKSHFAANHIIAFAV